MYSVLKFIILFSFVVSLSCNDTPKEIPPNIILFLVDDMGWQDTSVPFWKEKTPLNEKYSTPNMERLAAQGVKFTNAYATPVCSPTRISLMTGMNAARHRVTNWTLRKDEMKSAELNQEDLIFPKWNVNGLSIDKTLAHSVYANPLPQVLNENGYYTIHAGKAHLGAIGTLCENPLNFGFDVNIAGHAAGAPGSYHGTDNFGNVPGQEDRPWNVPGLEKYHGQDIFLTEAITREAISALQNPIESDQPFFLYMSLYGVHTPIMADDRFIEKYYDRGLDTIEARYASMVESMDKSLGDLMDELERNDVADETIILFMSDNGGLSAHARGGERHTHNAPLKSGKGSIYEGGIREPMIVKWSGVTSDGTTIEDPVIIEDFFPTILEMAQINVYKVPQTIDGKSFVPLLRSGETDAERLFVWHYPNRWGASGPGIGAYSAIRKGDWKLIYSMENQTVELYDLSKDIGENNDLSQKNVEKVNKLAIDLGSYLRSVDAQRPIVRATERVVPWVDEVVLK